MILIPNWSQLPEELLHVISTKLDCCFDVIHSRSICTTWRSALPFPHHLLRPSYSLPNFGDFPYDSEDFCTLEKVPLFLFIAKTDDVSVSELKLGGIGQDKSNNHIDLPSPIQCSVRKDKTVTNMSNYHIHPLGYQYRMMGWNPESIKTAYKGVAFLPVNKEGEFVVLLNYTREILVLKSSETCWKYLKPSDASCDHIVVFKGKFYATFCNREIFVFDHYMSTLTPLPPPQLPRVGNYLVKSGDDEELLLIQRYTPNPIPGKLDFRKFALKVSRLDEKAGTWVGLSDLGDRVLFLGRLGNVCWATKEFPVGCGLTRNSIVFLSEPCNVTCIYKYGVDPGIEGADLNCWRFARETRVVISKSFFNPSPIASLRIGPEPPPSGLPTLSERGDS